MKNNVILLPLVVLIGIVGAQLVRQSPGASSLKVVLEQELVTPGPEILVTSVVVEFPPSDPGTPTHTHSGPVVVYIIEGEMLFQVKDGPYLILRAGDAYYEKDHAVHVWGANACNSTNLKFLATVYGRPGEPYLKLLDGATRNSYEEALSLAKSNHYSSNRKSS